MGDRFSGSDGSGASEFTLPSDGEVKETLGQKATKIAILVMGGCWLAILTFTVIVSTYLTINGDPAFSALRFDPYPFGFLTLSLSLFANYQAMFVLLANAYTIKRSEAQDRHNRMMIEGIYTAQKSIYGMQSEQIEHTKLLKRVMENQSLMLDEVRQMVLIVMKETEETGDHVEAVLERVTADTLNVME